jgi:preprotein translocase subunit SecF
MPILTKLRTEIQKIKARNIKVEADKAWETSITRKVILIILTYVVIVITLFTLGLPNPFANAIIPTLAFFLSTLTIPFFKKWWINNIYKKN